MSNITQQPTTKKQRRLMRKQQKEQERQNQLRGKKIKKAILIAAPLAVIAAVIIVFALKSSPIKNQNTEHPGTPKMEIPEKEYDAGQVSMAAGKVKHTYEIKNAGMGDLKIDSIWTSCHCTTAKLKINNKTSSEFGMDKRSTLQKIAPGEIGFLEVVFDPAFHGPQGMGQAVRIIYLSTNDPQNKKAEIKFLADVVE